MAVDKRATRLGEELSDHGAQPDHHGDEPKRVADTLLKRSRDIRQRHSGSDADEERPDGQRDERRNSDERDQNDDEGDTKEGNEEQGTGVDGGHGVSELTMI